MTSPVLLPSGYPSTASQLPGGIKGPGPNRSNHDVLLDFLDRYRGHAELAVRELFGVRKVEPWQRQVLAWYDAREPRISVRSGHGVGKTALEGWLIILHSLFEYPQKTAVTAPTSGQLWDALRPEVDKWVKKMPSLLQSLLDLKTERIEFIPNRAESFVTFKTSRPENPEAMQGVHSNPGSVLLLGDEASGIDDKVYEAAGGSMSGPRVMMLLAGNPVRASGYFFNTHTLQTDRWKTLKVSVFESSVSGGQAYADEIAAMYGENSNAYRVRVLGEFPTSEDDTVIPFELVEAATNRDVRGAEVPVIWGLDVAHMGADRTALAKRRGNALMEPPLAWSKLESEDVAARVKTEWDTTPAPLRPAVINIDVIGYGAAVLERLRALGLPARGINVSETSTLKRPEVYRNLRAELWFEIRAWFGGKDVTMPKSVRRDDNMERLIQELTLPTYDYTPQTRKIFVESKQELKSRGYRSPDLADAFMLTFASDHITLARGLAGQAHRAVKRTPPRIA